MSHALFQVDERTRRRQRNEIIAKNVLLGAAGLSVAILALLLLQIILEGISALSLEFFTSRYLPSNVKNGTAGIVDAVMVSVIILLMTMALAVPLGLGGAIYLNEYAQENWFRRSVQNWIANLAAIPSVVYGLLGLALFVRFFALGANMIAAAATMALLILPIIVVSTQEALKAVPHSVREASYGLGATRWQTVRHHVLPNALAGILTGNILAMSRAAGETAPLIVLGMPVFVTLLGFGPLDTGTPLQVRIYFLAQDARVEAHALAAGAVIVLVGVTLLLNLAAILLRSRYMNRTQW